MRTVEQYGVFEYSLKGPATGNPFTEHMLEGVFSGAQETVHTEGFYDGDGVYKIRFMPSFTGEYTFRVKADFLDEEEEGCFSVLPAGRGNHGPVRVAERYHFSYEDGTPYLPVGTTCYVWTHQSDELFDRTLETLAQGPFNKIRFCVFPKHYRHNFNEPVTYPFEGEPCDSSGITRLNFKQYTPHTEGNRWDFTRFVPEHFRRLERAVSKLCELGIEADLILFHPYDRWGFSAMGQEADLRYVRYVTARFAAFRNIWWSLANEFDLFDEKNDADWTRIAHTVCERDPYRHLRSIHNCRYLYDYTRAWVTHCSIQRTETFASAANTEDWRIRFGKPVVLDEVGYEGDIDQGWGNLTGEEMTRLFWTAAVRGGYCGHGETYLCPENVLWWSHGGILRGKSPARIAFLKNILTERVPGMRLDPADLPLWDGNAATAHETSARGKYYLAYCGNSQPGFREFYFDDDTVWRVHLIDTWNMTVTDAGTFRGHFIVDLPARPYMAIELAAQPQTAEKDPVPEEERYTNPILPMDFSDPDVIRTGDDYYMVSSSFTYLPGVPLLHSKDLVAWEHIGYCVKELPFARYGRPAHGCGTWAPSIRFHDGMYYVFIPLPDEGIFVTSARDPRGEWSPLRCIKQACGWIDPCPLWDDDGSVYLAHAFAASRCGIRNKIQISRLDAETLEVIDDGPVVFDGTQTQPVAEGPKLYRRDGWYYIFIPAGGVTHGWQTVLRSRSIYGPYEERIVLHQGETDVNGPHQGAWVTDVGGNDWFIHFQDAGIQGRITHLQPMTWKDGWPCIGVRQDEQGTGEPVAKWKVPEGKRIASPLYTPDPFADGRPGPAWQWQANPRDEWVGAGQSGLALRICGAKREPLWRMPNLLSRMIPGKMFSVKLTLCLENAAPGDACGLTVWGREYSFAELCCGKDGSMVLRTGYGSVPSEADSEDNERICLEVPAEPETVLCLSVDENGMARYFREGTDGRIALGEPFPVAPGVWTGARIGLFARGERPGGCGVFRDVVIG